MEFHFCEKELSYDGSQLRSHFAYENFGILGDSCVAFLGPCRVPLENLVDLEDRRRQVGIVSKQMLHFILETFQGGLESGVLLQRLLVSWIQERLQAQGQNELKRVGDDLFWRERKLNVSIATCSPVSTLIHLGINIDPEGAPVPAVGLSEWGVDGSDFAKKCLAQFREELQGIKRAHWKVRAVP